MSMKDRGKRKEGSGDGWRVAAILFFPTRPNDLELTRPSLEREADAEGTSFGSETALKVREERRHQRERLCKRHGAPAVGARCRVTLGSSNTIVRST